MREEKILDLGEKKKKNEKQKFKKFFLTFIRDLWLISRSFESKSFKTRKKRRYRDFHWSFLAARYSLKSSRENAPGIFSRRG